MKYWIQRGNIQLINPNKIAGIYLLTLDGVVSFTMFTKEASPFFSKIHNSKNRNGQYRQLVLLDKEFEREWLRDDLNENHINELFKVEYNDESLITHPVSRDLFSRSIDSNTGY
ncbi:SOS response-associated peptidase family protein [Aquimarina sp. AU474]|uniref:SOS response-associated peptidase family protein n=1 Tax=Aquimarina sp. AU474 TaxID=2108529 RepID=UPI00135A4073|nr:SOS response-associated peptidase family protein [Aquimarina sp. AU474]